jgi:hypothetical protein
VLHAAVTKQNSFPRHLQGDEEADLEVVCQELLSSMGIGCACVGLSNGNVRLECPDSSCLWCDEDFERCGNMTYSLELGANGPPPTYIVGTTASFQYTTGETVAIEQSSCVVLDGYPNSCSECLASVNGEQCTSCAMCGDGYSYSVDCENLATSSSFSDCFVGGPEYGIFQGLGFYTCQYEKPNNDECSNSAPLQFGLAMIGRTNGATEDSISSSCNLVDGKDVWYSVVGTGNNIVATTCSYDTYVGTTIDVFSGPDSCEDLECIVALQSGCGVGQIGGTVSWPSEAGESYHLRVVTTDYDDQFEIVVWDAPPSENTACTSSAVSNPIDAVGSTLELPLQLETDICDEFGTPGLWYQVTAVEDGVMRASTCSNRTSIGTTISVMTGNDCDTLSCVKSANPYESTIGCTDVGTSIEWNVTSDQTYFVYIRGTDSNGIFGISIESLEVPDNDICAAATVLSLDDGVMQGNTVNATEDFIVGTPCGEDTNITPRGVWYKIGGSGNFLRANVCPGSGSYSESAISVYTGDCSDLVCAALSSYTNCGDFGGRTVSWEALEGVEYYLFVHSPYGPGSFELRVEEFEPATNIQCATAQGPLTPSNQTIVASTLNSVTDGIPGCVSGSDSAGVWYSVVGKQGLTYRVDTCSEETNFDTEISIFRGSCGGELECVAGNDESCSGTTSSVVWKTEEDVTYYIKVHGYFGAVGDFGMTLSSFANSKNDACVDSIVLSPDSDETVVVSAAGSTPDVVPVCSYATFDAPGIWYQLEGNGKAITISTCSPLTSVAATSLSLFTGSCEDLLCVSQGIPDYDCQNTLASKVIFLAEEGNTYFILLQTTDGYGGDVGLTITEFEGAENDFCQRASSVMIDGGEVAVTTVDASGGSPSTECYIDPSIPDVWYSVDGTGDVLEATACSSEFYYFTMALFQGSCTELNCVGTASSDRCATLRFQSVIGETYRILFQSFAESGTGILSLSVNTSSVEAPNNDLCSNAELIDPSSNITIFGSTTDALQDIYEEDACWGVSTGRDVWYKVVGNSAGMLASLCNPETDFDSQLSIYSSSDEDESCSTLECVTTNDDACGGSGSQVWWLTEQDRVYLIRVHGYGDSFGNFALTVSEQGDEVVGRS